MINLKSSLVAVVLERYEWAIPYIDEIEYLHGKDKIYLFMMIL